MSVEFRKFIDSLPPDHFSKAYMFTSIGHHDEYDYIKPENPKFSQEGKIVVITGGSSGIGRHGLAPSFARAGAKAIYLVARNQSELEAAKKEVEVINPNVQIIIRAMSVTDEMAARELFREIKEQHGKADVLLNSAGIGNGGILIGPSSVDSVWSDFEVNIKGCIIMSRYFAETLGKIDQGHIINITSSAGLFFMPGTDSYGLSKLIQAQMQRYISAGNPNIQATSLQPGAVLTNITKPGFERFSIDTPALSGGTALWLTTPEAEFMNSRFMDATWDIPEVLERKEEIRKDGLLLIELKGDFTKGR